MSNAFTRQLAKPVPQQEQADARQVQNNAGGYTFTLSDKERLERFLILGTDGGTYYVNEREYTKQNLAFLDDLIERDEDLVRRAVYDVSYNARSYRNSPAIFALAKLLVQGKDKQAVIDIGPDVLRTSTHLFEFSEYLKLLTGSWSRAKRRFVQHWYHRMQEAGRLPYQMVKYRQRGGWKHADLLRLAHAGIDPILENFAGRHYNELANKFADFEWDHMPKIVEGFYKAQSVSDVRALLRVLDDYRNLPWEALPTEYLREPEVWRKLFYNEQLFGQALVRNITRLARIGAFNDLVFAADYAARLTDEQMIRRTRLHPINFLNALVVHTEGQIVRDKRPSNYPNRADIRKKDWQTVPTIVDALNAGFHLAFKHVEPARRRTFLAVDVSGSMTANAAFGLDLSAAQVAAAMALTIAKTEPYYMIKGFTSNNEHPIGGYRYGRRVNELTDLDIAPSMDLATAMRNVQKQNFGATDCALPMLWARDNKIEIDTFVVITDNETWAGEIHAHEALRRYRTTMGINAKLIVAGVSATEFTIADPNDAGSLDIVGFDANAPKIIADFSADRI